MATPIKLAAAVRKNSAKVTRREGAIPAVVYGHELEPKSIQVDSRAFLKVFKQTGESSLIALDMGDGLEHTVLVRDIQRHPIKDSAIHIDFYQVRLDEVIEADVPLKFVGESVAVKDLAGVLVHPLSSLKLEALPQDLPPMIEVDIASLDSFAKVITVADIKVPSGVKLLHESDEVVALVQEPKSQEELDAELAEEVKEDVTAVEGVADKPEEEAATPAEGEAAAEPAAKPEEKKE